MLRDTTRVLVNHVGLPDRAMRIHTTQPAEGRRVTLPEILDHLDRMIAESAPDSRPGLVVSLAARLAQLGAGLAIPSTAAALAATPGPTQEGNISAREAARRLGISASWIYKNARVLPFTVKIGGRVLCSAVGVEKYNRQRAAASKERAS